MLDHHPSLFKFAHISDLHFSHLNFSLENLTSKSLVGNLNLLFRRKRLFKETYPKALIDLFKKEQISHVLISGDLSTTSSRQEFEKAKQFTDALRKEKIEVFVIPGNHDNYTKKSFKNQLFYDFFSNNSPSFLGYSLKNEKVCAFDLGDNYWIILMDTTHHTPFYLSTGHYTAAHDRMLKELLSQIPKNSCVILVNHFPLFDQEHATRRMEGSSLLRKTLTSYPQVQLYLHGHTHHQHVQDCRKDHLPIIADSGSVSHVKKGSWNLYEFTPSSCHITTFKKEKTNQWQPSKHLTYAWSHE